MICRTVDEARAAARLRDDPPLTQEQADYVAALIAPHLDGRAAA